MSDYVKPQPAPTEGNAVPTWNEVTEWFRQQEPHGGGLIWGLLAEDGAARDAFGAAKYGTRHQHDNGRDHAVDAYQELLDGCMYWWAQSQAHGHERRVAPSAFGVFLLTTQAAYAARQYLYVRDGK